MQTCIKRAAERSGDFMRGKRFFSVSWSSRGFCGKLTIHSCFEKVFYRAIKPMCQNSQQKFCFSVGVFRHEMPVRLIKLRWRSLSGSFPPSSLRRLNLDHESRIFSSTSDFPSWTSLKRQPIHLESNFPRTIEYRSCNLSSLDMDALFIVNIKENFPIVERINADFHETRVAERTPSRTSEAQVSKFESEGRTKSRVYLATKPIHFFFSYFQAASRRKIEKPLSCASIFVL